MFKPPSEDVLVHELDQIRMALKVDETLGAADALETGRKVRIKGGPFMGVEGVVASAKKKGLVRLNIDMIGQAVLVEVDLDFVEIID